MLPCTGIYYLFESLNSNGTLNEEDMLLVIKLKLILLKCFQFVFIHEDYNFSKYITRGGKSLVKSRKRSLFVK